ncbi:hypothetical protein XI09_28755 [Bradyrhizobium sp. CCBAU 11386]|nr:hypothetical protein [Bradyrhizobium sp. CCBAU 11386]
MVRTRFDGFRFRSTHPTSLICNRERVASKDDFDRKRLAERPTDAIDPKRPLTQDQPILSTQLSGGNV